MNSEPTWVYQSFEPGLWTVGFYRPDGHWRPESDHDGRDSAARRVHYLNGCCKPDCEGAAS